MRTLYSFFSFVIISQSLLGMDQTELIKDVILSNVTFLSHDDICSLALVNKKYNKIVQETVTLRKNHLTEYALTQGPFFYSSFISGAVKWHKNGCAYTYTARSTECKTFKLVYLA